VSVLHLSSAYLANLAGRAALVLLSDSSGPSSDPGATDNCPVCAQRGGAPPPVAGSAGDYDPAYMVTIGALPETGNNFLITPFSAVGDVPVVGSVWMMGHGGMNKGVVYVHHGGETKVIEPKDAWEYGIGKGASIIHMLRFAKSARSTRDGTHVLDRGYRSSHLHAVRILRR
jgi:hypothetical protein